MAWSIGRPSCCSQPTASATCVGVRQSLTIPCSASCAAAGLASNPVTPVTLVTGAVFAPALVRNTSTPITKRLTGRVELDDLRLSHYLQPKLPICTLAHLSALTGFLRGHVSGVRSGKSSSVSMGTCTPLAATLPLRFSVQQVRRLQGRRVNRVHVALVPKIIRGPAEMSSVGGQDRNEYTEDVGSSLL